MGGHVDRGAWQRMATMDTWAINSPLQIGIKIIQNSPSNLTTLIEATFDFTLPAILAKYNLITESFWCMMNILKHGWNN